MSTQSGSTQYNSFRIPFTIHPSEIGEASRLIETMKEKFMPEKACHRRGQALLRKFREDFPTAKGFISEDLLINTGAPPIPEKEIAPGCSSLWPTYRAGWHHLR